MSQPVRDFGRRHFPALMERGVRLYVSGQLALVIGSWSQNVGLNLLVYEQTGSATVLGLLNFLLFGPMLLVAPLAGAWVSSRRVKPILLTALLCNALVSVSLAFTALAAEPVLLHLLLLAVFCGLFTAIETPARLVLVAASVDRPELTTNALGLNVLAVNVGRTIGAAVGALVFRAAGASFTFLLFVAGLLLMAGCVTAIRVRSAEGGNSAAGGLWRAIAYARHHPFAAFFLPVVALVGLFASSYPTLVPMLAAREFGDAAKFTGLFLSCGGAGAVVSSLLLASRLGDSTGRRFVRSVPWVIGTTLGAIAFAPSVWAAGLFFFLLGAGITFTNAASSSVMLQESPAHFRGAIAGLYSMAFAGILPFGHLLAGWLTDAFGVRKAFGAMALGLLASLAMLQLLHRIAFQKRRSARHRPRASNNL